LFEPFDSHLRMSFHLGKACRDPSF
jgi:hypothetical protein